MYLAIWTVGHQQHPCKMFFFFISFPCGLFSFWQFYRINAQFCVVCLTLDSIFTGKDIISVEKDN
jgi:hypothetical protein